MYGPTIRIISLRPTLSNVISRINVEQPVVSAVSRIGECPEWVAASGWTKRRRTRWSTGVSNSLPPRRPRPAPVVEAPSYGLRFA